MGSSGAGDRVTTTLKNCAIDMVIARRLGVGIDDNVNMIAAKGAQYKTLLHHNNGVSWLCPRASTPVTFSLSPSLLVCCSQFSFSFFSSVGHLFVSYFVWVGFFLSQGTNRGRKSANSKLSSPPDHAKRLVPTRFMQRLYKRWQRPIGTCRIVVH